jgi:hypothetical protein
MPLLFLSFLYQMHLSNARFSPSFACHQKPETNPSKNVQKPVHDVEIVCQSWQPNHSINVNANANENAIQIQI